MDTNATMDTSNTTLSSWIVSINGKISILSITFIATFVVSIIPIYILFLRRSARRILDIEIEEKLMIGYRNGRSLLDMQIAFLEEFFYPLAYSISLQKLVKP